MKPHIHFIVISHSPLSQLLEPTSLLSVSVALPVNTSYKWNHTIGGLLHLASSTYNVLSFHVVVYTSCIIASYGGILLHCTDIPHSVYPFITWWTPELFHFLAFVICMWAFLWTSVYSSWGATPRSGIPGPYSRSILNPPRSCPTAFP